MQGSTWVTVWNKHFRERHSVKHFSAIKSNIV